MTAHYFCEVHKVTKVQMHGNREVSKQVRDCEMRAGNLVAASSLQLAQGQGRDTSEGNNCTT